MHVSAVYGGSHAFLKDFLSAKCNIQTTFVPIYDLAAVEAAIKPNTRCERGRAAKCHLPLLHRPVPCPHRVIYCETCSNPTLRVADIPRLSEIAR